MISIRPHDNRTPAQIIRAELRILAATGYAPKDILASFAQERISQGRADDEDWLHVGLPVPQVHRLDVIPTQLERETRHRRAAARRHRQGEE